MPTLKHVQSYSSEKKADEIFQPGLIQQAIFFFLKK